MGPAACREWEMLDHSGGAHSRNRIEILAGNPHRVIGGRIDHDLMGGGRLVPSPRQIEFCNLGRDMERGNTRQDQHATKGEVL